MQNCLYRSSSFWQQQLGAESGQFPPASGFNGRNYGAHSLCQKEGMYFTSEQTHASTDTWRHHNNPFCLQQKPQYQPQLQMIQMVGPNDNDYIYINFKDFEYDQKWEFPRENLELGMNYTRLET